MDYLPLFLQLRSQPVVVVGGGRVAVRKVELLLKCRARVTVVAPELRDGLAKTHPGEMVEPYFSPAGLEIIMRCDPAPPKLIAFQLPSRDQLQQQLFVQQMSILGKSYLRDLRRDAVVETR